MFFFFKVWSITISYVSGMLLRKSLNFVINVKVLELTEEDRVLQMLFQTVLQIPLRVLQIIHSLS